MTDDAARPRAERGGIRALLPRIQVRALARRVLGVRGVRGTVHALRTIG
ncbi:MAG: hypothetical protein H0V92_06460, partial [Pseudonocardiales bacterium]|nr:hypothetical protein [Pseudonocardiales bacterium]